MVHNFDLRCILYVIEFSMFLSLHLILLYFTHITNLSSFLAYTYSRFLFYSPYEQFRHIDTYYV